MSRIAVVAALAALCSCAEAVPMTTVAPRGIEARLSLIPDGEPFLPPLSGHRLAVSGKVAAVADPEGTREDGRAPHVFLVDLATEEVTDIVLPDGSRPGAIELSAEGLAWVVMEGSRGVAAISVEKKRVERFVETCAAPVDLALWREDVWVACMSGEVVRVEQGATSANVVRTLPGAPVRIAVAAGAVHVACRDTTVVKMDAQDMVGVAMPWAQHLTPDVGPVADRIPRTAIPNTPRRLIGLPNGSVVLLHQQSVLGELTSPAQPMQAAPSGGGGPYSGSPTSPGNFPPRDCPGPAARGALTLSRANVETLAFDHSRWLATALPIDAASASGSPYVAIADAASGFIRLVNIGNPPRTADVNGCVPLEGGVVQLALPGVFSIAYDDEGQLFAVGGITSLELTSFKRAFSPQQNIRLRARSLPAGFMLFHSSAQPSLSPNVTCATCHPSGLTNGGTLTINGVTRKVMALSGHLKDATGVHWDNLSFQTAVVEGTWQHSMGGRPLGADEALSLRSYLDQLRAPPPSEGDPVQVQLGRAAFVKAQCSGCHDPSRHFTNNSQADVGRGMHRIPSLVGLGYSAPYMADGCAKTLEQRFSDEACGGGDRHGRPSLLDPSELEALVVFLKTL